MPSQSNVTEGKKTASRLLAREINLTPGLLDALRPTGNPERELNQRSRAPMNQISLSESAPLKKTVEAKNRPAQKRISPRQLQILVSFLGEP